MVCQLWKQLAHLHVKYAGRRPWYRIRVTIMTVCSQVEIRYLLDQKLQIQLQVFSLGNKFSVQQTCIFRSRITSHRVSASAAGSVYDWHQNYSISLRVSVFPTAVARQFFDGDCDPADLKNFLGWYSRFSDPLGSRPRKRGGFPVHKILHMPLHWLSLRSSLPLK